jgi:hypothetical protein
MSSSTRVRAVAIALSLAVSATSPARAEDDPLAEAMRLEAALDYNAALVIVEREIARGLADRERLVTLHMFAGKLAAGIDRAPIAEAHFAVVLALAPTTAFADGTSPKIVEPFDAARGRTAALRVTAKLEANAVSITASPDPNRIVHGIAVQLHGGESVREAQRLRVELPAGARPTHVIALDAFGNRVWMEAIDAAVIGGDDRQERTLRPLVARWPFWATGTAIALAAGGVCAWRFDKAQTEWTQLHEMQEPEFAKLEAIEARGRRWGLAANISFGVAATTTLIALITAARGSYATTTPTTAVITAQPDAVGLAIAGGF